MAKADLTAQHLRELLHYDPSTGIFTWLVKPNRRIQIGSRVGCTIDGGYLRTRIDGHLYRLHRLAWLYVNGQWPEYDIDHIDGNPANNAITNLRDVSRSVNLQNRREAMGHNKTGILGVSAKGTRWRARIKLPDGRQQTSHHATVEEAQAAYVASKREHHPGNML
jgi:hypothetical protein